jgi:hypothetical protein
MSPINESKFETFFRVKGGNARNKQGNHLTHGEVDPISIAWRNYSSRKREITYFYSSALYKVLYIQPSVFYLFQAKVAQPGAKTKM